jgi:hypothetical protein
MKHRPITPYGVPIREVIDNGNKDLMRAMVMVSDFCARDQDMHEDWAKAHKALAEAAH